MHRFAELRDAAKSIAAKKLKVKVSKQDNHELNTFAGDVALVRTIYEA
jgi:hypothetical protein